MHQLIGKKNKIAIYIIFLLILSTTSNKKIVNQNSYLTTINEITVVGLSDDNNIQIKNKLSYLFYESIFIISKKKIDKIISKFNIIEEYNVKKIYPSEIKINISPTKFVAKTYANNELIVGANGKILTNKKTSKILPMIVGKFDAKKFLEFKNYIDSSEFDFSRFKSITFYPSNRWDVLTLDNILIKLPEKNLKNSLKLAHKIIKNNQFKNNKIIDLRISDHIIIK
jgi:cell division protein FtsQ